MNAEDHPIPDPLDSESSFETTQRNYQSLRNLVHLVAISMILLTGSLFVFLLREVSVVRQDVLKLRQFVSDYETKSVPVMEEFRIKLQEFAKSDPEFDKILSRYITGTNGAGTGVLPVVPVPGGTNPTPIPVPR